MSINWASSDRGARVLDCSSQIVGNEAKHVLEPHAESMWRTDNRDKQSPNKTHWICLSLINIPRNTVIRTVGWHCASAYSSNPQSVFLHVSSDGIDFKAWDRYINPRQTKGTTLFCCSAPIDTEIYPYLVLEVTKTFGDVQKQEGCEKENNGSILDTYMEQIYGDKSPSTTNKSQGSYAYMNRIYLYSEEVPSSPLASLHRHQHSSPSSSSFSPSTSRQRPLPASPLPESYSPMPVSLSNHSSFLSPVGAMTRGEMTGNSVEAAVEWPSFTRHGDNSEGGESCGLNGSENSDSGRSEGDGVSGKGSEGDGGPVKGNEGDDSSGNVSALHSALGLSEEEAEEEEKERREGDDDGYCDEDSLDHLSSTAGTLAPKATAEMDNAIVDSCNTIEVNTPRREIEAPPPLVPVAAVVLTAVPPLVITTTTTQQTIDHHATSSSSASSGNDNDTIPPMTLPPLLMARLAYLEDQLTASSSLVATTNEDCMTRMARLEEQMRALGGAVDTGGSRGRGEKDEGGLCGRGEVNIVPTIRIAASPAEVVVSPTLAASIETLAEAPTTTTTTTTTTLAEAALTIAEGISDAESRPLAGMTSEVSSEVILLTALLHRKLSLRILKQAQLALLQQQ